MIVKTSFSKLYNMHQKLAMIINLNVGELGTSVNTIAFALFYMNLNGKKNTTCKYN